MQIYIYTYIYIYICVCVSQWANGLGPTPKTERLEIGA